MFEYNNLPPFQLSGHTLSKGLCDYYQHNVTKILHPSGNHSAIGFTAAPNPPYSITSRISVGNASYHMVCGSLYRLTVEVARRMNAGFVKHDNIDPNCLYSSFSSVCR